MSSSTETELGSVFSVPIAALEYRDMAGHPVSDGAAKPGTRPNGNGSRRRVLIEISEDELMERIARERAEATHLTEQRLRQEFESKLQAARGPIASALAAFDAQRSEYFARVEAEVVQLALAIAAKILHREAQVDPLLIAALVRMTIEKMREGSSVTVRVGTGQAKRWKEYFAGQPTVAHAEVTEDAELSDHDCMLETELGSANFGLDTQLKEVEQGFFDLLALRPENR
jgi:flagellar assembly protein FliH